MLIFLDVFILFDITNVLNSNELENDYAHRIKESNYANDFSRMIFTELINLSIDSSVGNCF